DLQRYSKGEIYYETRDGDWNPAFGGGSMTEETLRIHLLAALEQATRLEMRTGTIEGIDANGAADVLGAPDRVVKDGLAGLLLEGLVEEAGATFGHGATEGACRITTEGARTLRVLRERLLPQSAPTRAIRSVLFTDIVGSTERVAEIGD